MEGAGVGGSGRMKVTLSLFDHKYLLLLFFVLYLPCSLVMVCQSLGMMCVEHVMCACSG